MNCVPFVKLHGNANDFVLIDTLRTGAIPNDWRELAQRWCARRTGIGADGLLIVEPAETADYRMRILNADGSTAEMCGNGIRCFAHYLFQDHCPERETLAIETDAGIKTVWRRPNNHYTVQMGVPTAESAEQSLTVGDHTLPIWVVNTGTPHAVIFTDALAEFPLETLGPAIEHHPLFPGGTNVQVAQVLSADESHARSWERGAGLTQACGTGACAVLVAGHLKGQLARQATVRMPGGPLLIEWKPDGELLMTGPAVEVFRGEIALH
ncbi:MAG: diaminopimelate epimerase [Fimbriimonadales bacterium]